MANQYDAPLNWTQNQLHHPTTAQLPKTWTVNEYKPVYFLWESFHRRFASKKNSISFFPHAGFKISLVLSFEMSKNDSRASGIPAGLVRWTTAYFWFSHKLHWLWNFRQVNGTFGQLIFTIHLPDGQVHSIWNFEACHDDPYSAMDCCLKPDIKYQRQHI